MTFTKRNTIALAILLVALLTLLLFLCVCPTLTTAEAEAPLLIESEYLTGNYRNFGEILSIGAVGASFYTAEILNGTPILRIVDTDTIIELKNTAAENYRNIEIAAFADKVFVKQDDGIYSYTINSESKDLEKFVDLKYLYKLDDTEVVGEYKSFGGAEKDGILIVDYTSIIVFFDITKSSSTTLEKKKIASFAVNSTNSFDKIVVQNTEIGNINLHLYDSKNGNRFTRSCVKNPESGKYEMGGENTQNAIAVFEGVDLYTYFNGGLELKADGLYHGETRAIKISVPDDNGVSDDYIRKFSKMSASGDYLYIVDNGQNAVKVFNSNYELYSLYGSYGQGVGANDRGLTRFRNPKYLCFDYEHIALFDEGNARIVLLDHELKVLATYTVTNVSGMCLNDGVWFTVNNTLNKLDFDLKTVVESFELDTPLSSLTTDGSNVIVVSDNKVYTVSGSKLVQKNEEFTINSDIICGKHDGIFYTIDGEKLTIYKDYKEIISSTMGEHDFFAVDIRGNVLAGSKNNISVYSRKLNGFDLKNGSTNLELSEMIITADGKIFAISENGLVKVNYQVMNTETDFTEPEITYPVTAIKVNANALAYVRPDNYESVVEVPENSYVMLAQTTYNGNDYYFTELLKDGKFIKIFIPAPQAEKLSSGTIDNEFIKYGGADSEPKAYKYPSLTAEPVANIVKGQSYKVINVVADLWKWYEIEVDGISCYVNGDNYITAEPLYKTVERYYLRAKSDVLGERIKLYKLPDENSEIIDFVGEGAVLELTEPYNENSEFLQIRYNKSIAYVRTRNIQKDGLTEGQKFALCFAGTIVGITAIFGILTLVVKKRRKE